MSTDLPEAAANLDPDDPLRKAMDDLKEWMVDHHAEAIVANLRPGATGDEVLAVEARLGRRFPAALRQLYSLHDGSAEEANPFFAHREFLSLEQGLRLMSSMLGRYFGVQEEWEPGDPEPAIDHDAIYCDEETPLREQEYSAAWWPLAVFNFSSYLAVNLDTGRVFDVEKDVPALRLLADDLAGYLADYATAVWDDHYVLAGDTELEGVEQDGFVNAQRHLARC